jgi:uncharacterized SAM-binding protein YcdF (DUF218 family)
MRKIVSVVLILLCWFFLHCLWVVQTGLQPFTGKADVAIVLGTTVFPDGSLSPWLKGRVDEALRLYRNGQVKKIFVSGGIDGDRPPEGDMMRNYLISQGVNPSAIITDNKGNNTYLTAGDFMQLNATEQFSSAVVVSSFYHVLRCKFIIRKLGFKNIEGAGSSKYFWNDWFSLTREFLAYYEYMVKY